MPIKKWDKIIEKYLFLLKDGFFELPYLSNSPKIMIDSIAKMPVFKHKSSEQAIHTDNPFCKGTLKYRQLDEARIWNKVLTQAEIQEKMNCEFAGPQPGLVGYYKFNQGIESADNSTITTLTDSSGNANHGTLINFDLSEYNLSWTGSSIIQTGNTCTILSVGDHHSDFSSDIKVYPNPSGSTFFIDSSSAGSIVLFDILGKIIQTQKLNSGTTSLDLSNTPNGLYLLKVTNERNQSKTIKLVKN